MKTIEQLKPSYAPVYAAAMYPELARLFQKHGYALAVHGSLARDFDLIAVPWAEKVSQPRTVLRELTSTFSIKLIGKRGKKNHGRYAYTYAVGFGHCSLDLSFFPVV